MGFMNALFGGGTKLELKLDSGEIPAGGQLSGQITVQGGKKPLTINSLFVRLLLVSVKSKEGSSVPDVDTRLLVNSTIATNEDLPPGELKTFSFRFPVPTGLEPSALATSYTVMAQADIPGVADPSATAKLKIVEGRGDDVLTLDGIRARYPNLESTDTREQVFALSALACDCYSEREKLIAAEPLLVGLVKRSSSPKVRREALSTWANLVDDQVRKEHLAFLQELSASSEDPDFFREVVTAAAKFAEEGALPMVRQLIHHSDPEVRVHLTQQLRFNSAKKFKAKRELIDELAKDPDSRVRAAAIEAWAADWRSDPALMRHVAGLCESDPLPEIQAAVISALALCHNYGNGTLGLEVFEKQLGNPSAEVRKAIAEHLHWLPETEVVRTQAMVERLLFDPSGEVREAMAFQLQNLSELKSLIPLAQKSFETDPSESVRGQALTGLCALLDPASAAALCEKVLASNPPSSFLWGVLSGMRNHREAVEAKRVLAQLAAGNTEVAESARLALQ